MMNVLITGASSGIGAATALALDRQGVNVFAGVEGPDDGEQALAGSSERLRRVVLDVSSDASIRAALEEIDRDLGGEGLDGVVNNAGIGVPGPLEALPLDDLRRQLEVNASSAGTPRPRRPSRASERRRRRARGGSGCVGIGGALPHPVSENRCVTTRIVY
jgi:NAD(P)-dependent dehydrogenase (short-subunit alcohol dehydrogenase family)